MKTKKFVSLLVALSMLLTLGACSNASAPETAPEPEEPNMIMFNDFENYANDFAPMQITGLFGRINLNDDKQYVLSGDHSALMEINGVTTSPVPTLAIPLHLERKGMDMTDLREIGAIEANFFNASDHDIDVSCYMSDSVSSGVPQNYVLKPNEWTAVTIRIDRAFDEFMMDLSDMSMITFQFMQDADVKLAPVYLDAIKMYRETRPYVPIERNMAPGEIAFFESEWQLSMLKDYNTGNAGTVVYYSPRKSINIDPTYSKEGKSLKLAFYGNAGDAVEGYAGVTFTSGILSASEIGQMKVGDTVSLDVYNPQSEEIRLFFAVNNPSGRMMVDNFVYLAPESWTTLTYTYNQITMGSVAGLVPNGQGSFVGIGGTVQSITSISISWRYDSMRAGEYILYMDNFRIEKGAVQA